MAGSREPETISLTAVPRRRTLRAMLRRRAALSAAAVVGIALVFGSDPAGAWPDRQWGAGDGWGGWDRRGDRPPAPPPSTQVAPAPEVPAPEIPAPEVQAPEVQAPAVSAPGAPPQEAPAPAPAADTGSFWGGTGSIPAAQNVLTVKVLNRTNGRYPDDQVFWSFNGQTHSVAEQPYLDMPVNSAGRMYLHLGSPDSPYADFIEFTVQPAMFYGNTTRVEAFGLKLAMRLHAHDGFDMSVGENEGTFAESREATFQRYRDSVPNEFKHLADVQAPYRILAPWQDAAFKPGGASANYFGDVGVSTYDILACAGPLANDPNRCAALNRGQSGPANYYAKFWHDVAIGGLAYGFAYDDVGGQSSLISHGNPQYLLVAVGW